MDLPRSVTLDFYCDIDAIEQVAAKLARVVREGLDEESAGLTRKEVRLSRLVSLHFSCDVDEIEQVAARLAAAVREGA
jgi:hypothetical protein